MPSFSRFVTAADQQPVPNAMLTVTKVLVTTTVDVTPPAWGAGFPRLNAVTDADAALSVALGEPGRVDWVLLRTGASPPSRAAITAGIDGNGAPGVAAGSVTVPVAGDPVPVLAGGQLEASTAYVQVRHTPTVGTVVTPSCYLSQVSMLDGWH